MKVELTPVQIEAIFEAGRSCMHEEMEDEKKGRSWASGQLLSHLANALLHDTEAGITAGLSDEEKSAWWDEFEREISQPPEKPLSFPR